VPSSRRNIRADSPFPLIGGGNPADYNPVTEGIVNDILTDPAAKVSIRVHGDLGPIMDIYGEPVGYGLHYTAAGDSLDS
jgi:hypothetical protein